MPYFVDGIEANCRFSREIKDKSRARYDFRRCTINDKVSECVLYYHPGGNSGVASGGSKYDPTIGKIIERKNPTDKAWFEFCT